MPKSIKENNKRIGKTLYIPADKVGDIARIGALIRGAGSSLSSEFVKWLERSEKHWLSQYAKRFQHLTALPPIDVVVEQPNHLDAEHLQTPDEQP